MKRTTLAACIIAALIIVVLTVAASATSNIGVYRSGVHWCNWSAATSCRWWRANKDRPGAFSFCGPNDMRSRCVAHRRGLR
jgi:hypothetical protein